MTCYNGHLQVTMKGLKDMLCVTQWAMGHTTASMMRFFSFDGLFFGFSFKPLFWDGRSLFVLFFFLFNLYLGWETAREQWKWNA